MEETSMNESEVFGMVVGAAAGVPAPVKTAFFKAVSELMGGAVAIPAAKLRQLAQAIDDTTAARSLATAALSKAAVSQAVEDPLVLQAAAELYLPSSVRKVKNRLLVAASAVEHVAGNASESPGEAAKPPDEDWMNAFMRFAEDASSERLQDLFGRILAGQVLRPGAFGLSTLRALSELDQTIADDFTKAWTKSVGEAVDYSSEWRMGEWFARWKRLSEAGLMAPASTVRYLPNFHPRADGSALWTPFAVGNTHVTVYFQANATSSWEHVNFTRIGREIGTLLPSPDYATNMRQAARRLPRGGVSKVVLVVDGGSQEQVEN